MFAHTPFERFGGCQKCERLTTDCPGRNLTDREVLLVRQHGLDFVGGAWIYEKKPACVNTKVISSTPSGPPPTGSSPKSSAPTS